MNPLTVFPRHPSAPDTYYINGAWAPAAITAVEKRFTDAELAAEYWRTSTDAAYITEGITWKDMCDGWSANEDDALERYGTLHRFATLPQHDDGPA